MIASTRDITITHAEHGVGGQLESIEPGRVSVTGDWGGGAELVLRPGAEVVVITRRAYDELYETRCCSCGGC
jgi:hypothetical protein